MKQVVRTASIFLSLGLSIGLFANSQSPDAFKDPYTVFASCLDALYGPPKDDGFRAALVNHRKSKEAQREGGARWCEKLGDYSFAKALRNFTPTFQEQLECLRVGIDCYFVNKDHIPDFQEKIYISCLDLALLAESYRHQKRTILAELRRVLGMVKDSRIDELIKIVST